MLAAFIYAIRVTVLSIRTLLAALAALCFSTSAAAWWNPDWTARKAISINTTPAGVELKSELHDVPVLLRLHSGNFPQFLNVKDGGADFRFVDGDDQTPLKYHVEKFDAASQIALVWVKVPILKPNFAGNKIYLYFGNQKAPKGDDAGATYDIDTTAVFHFADVAGAMVDSSAHATPATGAIAANPMSLLGVGATLTGDAVMTVQDVPQTRFAPDKGWAASGWLKFDALPKDPAYVLERSDGAQHLRVMLKGDRLVASLGNAEITATTPIMAGQWAHVALVIGYDQLQLYVNGALAGSAPLVLAAEMGGAITVGGGAAGNAALAMQFDELKLYAGPRSADFFAAQAAIEGEKNDRVVGYGADETADNPGGAEARTPSHFGIIIQNVFGRKEAIVEQSVIGVCVVMAAIAVMVMFMKAVFLGRSRRATDKFLQAYRAQTLAPGAQLDALFQGDRTYGDSPLFKIYKQGIEQVRGRLAAGVGAAVAGITEKSLNAIRATLDATAVREQQRLNSLLVLLTIAISGGPFIGLLGTVVGVMVTFATIAETGDINIAAIAPGMAAALLATVAGLGVAIPSLFGYNYLSAKAKDLAADMHVFADEFVAKVDEVHGL